MRLSVSLLVLLYCYATLRDLHSFPTRRSSDLPLGQLPAERQHPLHRRAGAEDRGGDAQDEELRPRSEEHTSELQSHVNLVCRLLPDKKKYRRTARQKCSTSSDQDASTIGFATC